MAKYDRRFLVPYLRDVCSVELLYSRTARDLASCEDMLAYARKKENRKAERVEKPSLLEKLAIHFIGYSIVIIFALYLNSHPSGILALLFVLVAGLIVGVSLATIWKIPGEYSHDLRKYEAYLAEQATYDKEKVRYRELANIQEKKITLLRKQQYSVKELRQQVYSVNVIPSKYRNLHAAYYLFDFFSSCAEDDLGRVIQTMLLDDIIARLDKIIAQNEEILLNQRYQIALQENQNRMMAKNHREQMKAIARMERNQELQMDYQRMMVQNQAVTNFFLTYDFLRKK